MKQVMVRYKVKPDQAERNEALVRQIYEELRQNAPSGLRYATFALEDGVSFVHIASIEAADGENPLTEVVAFRAFIENIADRCDEPPAPANLREIGSYGVWGK